MKTNSPAAARRHSRLRADALALAAGAVMALGSGAASALETTFTGYTDGCFGASCVPPSTPVTATQALTLDGLTYNNSTFDVTTFIGFASIGATATPGSNFDNLGSFTLPNNLPATTYSGNFDLLVTFTAPPGAVNPTFIDTVTGSVSGTSGGVFVNFTDNTQDLTFTGGKFVFFLNNLSLTPGKTVALTGTIHVTPVPEPETYALFLAGLAAVGFMARRRKA
jgi:hypothetical protein